MSGDDPSRAWQAILNLASAPKEAVPFVQKQLKPMAAPDDKQIAQWIKALDAEGFQEREDATEALVRAGRSAEAAVRKALDQAPSAEAKQRMQSILEKLSGNKGPNMEEVRAIRGVEVLERIGTPESAEGAGGSRQGDAMDRRPRRPDGAGADQDCAVRESRWPTVSAQRYCNVPEGRLYTSPGRSASRVIPTAHSLAGARRAGVSRQIFFGNSREPCWYWV